MRSSACAPKNPASGESPVGGEAPAFAASATSTLHTTELTTGSFAVRTIPATWFQALVTGVSSRARIHRLVRGPTVLESRADRPAKVTALLPPLVSPSVWSALPAALALPWWALVGEPLR